MVFGTPWNAEKTSNHPHHQTTNKDWSTGAKVAAVIGLTGGTIVAWPAMLGLAGWSAGGVVAGTLLSRF
jgi:hypothetical protein